LLRQSKAVWAILGLAALGLGISGYLTWYSYVIAVGVCPLNGYFTCSAVLTSSYSKIAGVPVALLGALWFVAVMPLSVLVSKDDKWLSFLLGWSVLGVAGVVGLQYIQIFLVRSICPLCTSAHIVGIMILAVTVSIWLSSRTHSAQ